MLKGFFPTEMPSNFLAWGLKDEQDASTVMRNLLCEKIEIRTQKLGRCVLKLPKPSPQGTSPGQRHVPRGAPSLGSGWVIGTDRWRSEPPCVYPPAEAGHMAKRRVGVKYSPSMLEPVRPGAASPDRALCLLTFSHFVIVNKTSLSPPP